MAQMHFFYATSGTRFGNVFNIEPVRFIFERFFKRVFGYNTDYVRSAINSKKV